MVTKIVKSPARFPSTTLTSSVKDSPSPTHYDSLTAFNSTSSPRGRQLLTKEKRLSFVDTVAKL